MSDAAPRELVDLLSAASPQARAAAWQRFVPLHSALILSVARSLGGSYDAVMDRYAYILEALQRDDCRRLRGYTADGRARFTTWLVVVCRRLCLDEHRSKFGRNRAGADIIRLQTRRAFADSLFSSRELEDIASTAYTPDVEAEHHELNERLERCVSALPPAERLLLKLRFEDDLSAADIARVLDAPTPFHIYRRLKHVLGRLRIAMTQPHTAAQNVAGRPLNTIE